MIGRRLGAYEIRSLLGSGGMGDVYRARDTRLGRDVAIKILPPAFADDADRLARFEREARLLASIDHPNIATIHGVEESDGSRALVLALVDGETLRARLVREPLTIDTVLDIASQVAGALTAAHAAGVVHRDVKPENVMIRRDGLVKVLDFGIAKAFAAATDEGATVAQTNAGVIVGTVAYMSPEQARGLAVDARSDLFSVGAIIYEILAGRRAFAGQTSSDVLAAVLEHQPEPLARRRPDVPRDLVRVSRRIVRCATSPVAICWRISSRCGRPVWLTRASPHLTRRSQCSRSRISARIPTTSSSRTGSWTR